LILSRDWSNRPQKRVIQDKLSRRIHEHYAYMPELYGESIISLAGENFLQATKGYYCLARHILIAERDPVVYSKIHSKLSAYKRNEYKKIMLIKGPIDVIDAINLPKDKKPISGLDLDFDVGKGSPISTYIRTIRKKFLSQLSTKAFWLRITVPARACLRTNKEIEKLITNISSSCYNIIDIASGPAFSYKDTAAMRCLQVIAKGKNNEL